MKVPNGLKFQMRCLGYLWLFRQVYPGNARHAIMGYALRRCFYTGLVVGGWAFTLFLLAAVMRPIFSPNSGSAFHAFDAFTLFLMPILIIGMGRFGDERAKNQWRQLRRRAILMIRRKRRAQSAVGPSGGVIFSAGRIH